MKLIALLLTAIALFGQGTTVNQTQGIPPDAFSTLLFYDGSGYLIYSCKAKSIQPTFTWTKAATTLTNIVVLTNVGTVTTSTAHGLAIGNSVVVSGATVDTDLNATYYIQTVPSTTTFTITTASVANATYTDATLQMTTTSPRSSANIWDIFKYTISGTTTVAIQKAGGKSGTNSICDDRATTTGSTKILYQ